MQAWQGPDGSGTPQLSGGATRKDNSFNDIQISGINKTHVTNAEAGQPGDGRLAQGRIGNTSQSQGTAAGRHLTNKSDSNLAAGQNQPGNYARSHGKREQSEGKKKRKNSDKAQRKASNNRRGDQKEGMIPPIEGYRGDDSVPDDKQKSHSKGAIGGQQFEGPNSLNTKESPVGEGGQYTNNQFFDQQNQYNQFNQNQGSPPQGYHNTFPFPMPGGGQQQLAPQVHFIAKKQQFIAQISPDQLVGTEKRPFTTSSLNGLNSGSKRAPGSVYANAVAAAASQKHPNSYNIANAAFANNPVYIGNIGSRTHTNGFGMGSGGGKFPYGEEYKPKIGGKDLMKALGSSNGFNSGYGSGPEAYNSVMSGGLPASITHSTRPTKGKAGHGRLQGKEKEQLYDETIKMKMLNNQMREEHVKLKTKVKILENELGRKEKTIEDLFSTNQMIQQPTSKSNPNQGNLPGMALTAQKYQQETFLVMSLKKQIRELKYEVSKRDEELEVLRKNIRTTRTQELEQEIQSYHEECLRLRTFTEELLKQGASHPYHQQAMDSRTIDLESQLAQKDALIQQLSEDFNAHLIAEQQRAGQTANAASLAGLKHQDSQHIESHASEGNLVSQTSVPPIGREKSGERKQGAIMPILSGNPGIAQGAQKDQLKELQKSKKALRDKEKEILKFKAEIAQLRKEQSDKVKNELQTNKDVETQVKTLREKLKEQRNEVRRREDKLADQDARVRRMEESLKSMTETVKQREDEASKLKHQLKTEKQLRQKAESKPEVEAVVQTASKHSLKSAPEIKEKSSSPEKSPTKVSMDIPKEELHLITIVGQREKLSRDDLTAMMLSGEESLRMLIKDPSDQLLEFIKAHLEDEDGLLAGIPRFEIPKADFESQVLREMRVVLRENAQKIADKFSEELVPWTELEEFYNNLSEFDYPHKDKLLDFIKYYFLDHIANKNLIMINVYAFKEHLLGRKATTPKENSRNGSNIRSARKSADSTGSAQLLSEEGHRKRMLATAGSEDDKIQDEERMLDIAEQCFMRMADLLHIASKTVRQVFLKYSQPELFKDGSILELMSPRGFLEGVRDIGFDDVTEMEAACLMKVLAKPELDNSVILNEFVLIMENFGVPVVAEEDEYENDYTPDSDAETEKKDEDTEMKKKEEDAGTLSPTEDHKKFSEQPKGKGKNVITINFDILDEKGNKILKKLAKFLLERYMHPREFFGPTIKKETFGTKKCTVEVIKLHDFYLRIKLASIRKKLKENVSLNQFLAIDVDKHPGYVQVKRMIKALEIVAETEQEAMVKEAEEKVKLAEEKAKKDAEERAAKGLPPVEEEEEEVKEDKKSKDAESKKKTKDFLESGKAPKPEGGLEEMMKIGGKSKKEKPRFASHLGGPNGQLGTIEEDLHETQTSHYSYQLKDGENGSERGHQLSTSNNLRNSNGLNEIDDISKQSNRNGGGKSQGMPMNKSVHSGDYSGGSHSSKKVRDIEEGNIGIVDFNNFKKKSQDNVTGTDRPHRISDSMRKYSIKEELVEEELTVPMPAPGLKMPLSQKHNGNKATTDVRQSKQEIEMDDEYDIDLEEVEQKMKDELDDEVNSKLYEMQQSEGKNVQKNDSEDAYGDYDEDQFADLNVKDPREDSVTTDQINQMIENDHNNQAKMEEEAEEEVEEYSYHDEESQEQLSSGKKNVGDGLKPNENDSDEIDEDYEF